MPDELRLLAQVLADRIPGIVIAIASGEDYDTEFHSRDVWGEMKLNFNKKAAAPAEKKSPRRSCGTECKIPNPRSEIPYCGKLAD